MEWYAAREKFTVDTSTSVYISFYLGAICKNVQPFVVGVPGVRCFQGQVSISVSVSPFIMFCCRCR